MTPRVQLIIIVLITIFFSCGKKNSSPTGPENTAPELSVIVNQTVTAGEVKNLTLTATDTDGNSLTFSISTNPGFLSITGFFQVGDTATATLVIAPDETITGTFDATIQVSDGMGGVDSEDFSIEVAEPTAEIIPGVGAANVKLNDSYSELKQIHGSYDSVMQFKFTNASNGSTYYMYLLTYESIKAKFYIYSSSQGLDNNDKIISIEVQAPYEGVTEENIGIGSSLEDVVDAYGSPTEIVTSYSNYYKYESLNTLFYFDTGETLVTKIRIYNPIHFPGI